jgi:hypothetical protein
MPPQKNLMSTTACGSTHAVFPPQFHAVGFIIYGMSVPFRMPITQ